MVSPYKNDLMDIEVTLVHQTPMAWLVNDGDKDVWIPKKWCELVKKEFVGTKLEKYRSRIYILTLPQDKAEELELC